MKKKRELGMIRAILRAFFWIWFLPSTCHAFVFTLSPSPTKNPLIFGNKPSSPPLFRLKPLYLKKPFQENVDEEDHDEKEDDVYPPYYDGEYHLGSKDSKSNLNVNPFSRRFTKSKAEDRSSGETKQVRPNFETVFQGMPGLSDILSGGTKKEIPTKTPSIMKKDPTASSSPTTDSMQEGQLSTTDSEEIERNFQKFKTEMRETLQQMRRKDPNSVPDNAEFILDQVVEEQRAYDIQEKLELRAKEAFDQYYQQQRTLNTQDTKKQQQQQQQNINIDSDPVVQEILEEMNEQESAKRQIEEQLLDFKVYEKNLREKIQKESKKYKDVTSTTTLSASQEDFDQIQLDIMRDLLIKRQDAALEQGMVQDEDLFTTNNLEDGIEELSNRIEEKQRFGKDTLGDAKWSLKDWQMYRSIVSNLVEKKKKKKQQQQQSLDEEDDDENDYINTINEDDIMDLNQLLDDDDEEEDNNDDSLTVDKKDISKKLESWKEYQVKEENMRKQMGLSMKVRGPFPWSDKLYKDETSESENDSRIVGKISFSRDEVEKASISMDQTAIQVMTDLMMKTQDRDRREKLRVEIEELKMELSKRQSRSDDYNDFDDILDIDDDDHNASLSRPFQISDILGKTKETETLDKKVSRADLPYLDTLSTPIQESPPSPKSSQTDADKFSIDADDDDEMIPSLGTLKEQKFRSLVARSGVRTVQEQEDLRRKWEDFQRAEQRMRDQTGLSGNDVSSVNLKGELKYNVSDVLLKGGDVNADAILSTIGKRPSRKNNDSAVSAPIKPDIQSRGVAVSSTQPSNYNIPESKKDSYQTFLEYEERIKAQSLRQNNDATDDDKWSSSQQAAIEENPPVQLEEENESISDQIYRSYGATIHRDPEKNRVDKNAFDELLRREEEGRKSLQEAANSSPVSDDLDIDTYADNVLSKLKPRPKPKKNYRARKSDSDILSDNMIERESPKSFEDTDNDDERPSSIKGKIQTSNISRSSSILSEQMPDWLRREIEEQTGDELKLEKDRIGIFSDDTYDDDDYEKRERQAAEFERKFSKAPKVVSISDLFGRDYFGPDDVGDFYDCQSPSDSFSSFESRKATLMQYRVLTVEDLNSLMEFKSSSIETGVSPYLAKVNRPFSFFGAIFRLEGSLLDLAGLHFEPWKKTAEEHGLKVPEIDDVKFAAVHSPEFSIQRIFYWTNDIIFVRSLAKSFRRNFSEFFESWVKSLDIQSDDEVPRENGQRDMQESFKSSNAETSKSDMVSRSVSLSEIDLLNVQINAWSIVADKFKFKAPSPENIQFTSGFTPEEAIKGVFMWTRDSIALSNMSTYYRAVLKEETNKLLMKKNIQPLESSQYANVMKPEGVENLYERNSKDSDGISSWQNTKKESQQIARPANIITEDDVVELHLKAWTYTAQQYGYRIPSLEEVQIAKFSGSEKAVQSIFKWASSLSSVVDVVSTFRLILKNLSLDLAAKVNINPPNERNVMSKTSDKITPYIVKDGIVDFLSALEKVNTPSAVISYLESHQLDLLLQMSGLDRFFKENQRVSESDAYETEVQQLLGAALRVERRPDLCAVFTSTPQSCVAAHDVRMKSVALVGPYPRYDLTTSDSTLINLDSMNTMNLRALFSDEKNAEPMEQLQVEGPQVKKKSLIKTRFWQEGDR